MSADLPDVPAGEPTDTVDLLDAATAAGSASKIAEVEKPLAMMPVALSPMPAFYRPPPLAPIAALEKSPQRFGFFQAARLIYQVRGTTARNLASDIGPIRFTTPQSLSFPASEIYDLTARGEEPRCDYRMSVNFMGLTGPSSVLPRHYTEWLIERRQSRDTVAQEFFDLFNQRMVTMFWRAWAKYRADIGMQFQLPNAVMRYVFDLVGMGTPSLHRRLFETPAGSKQGAAANQRRLPSRALAYYSGLISQRPHGIGTVSQVLGDFIGAPVTVEGCFGTWQAIPASDRTQLGQPSSALGNGCVLGKSVWDRQTTLQVRVGPLSWAQFHGLLPGGDKLTDTVELARFLTGLSIDLRIRPMVRHDEVQPLRFIRGTPRTPRLGWNTWLAGRRRRTPADDCEFRFSAMGGASWR
jgi:type VI secretion system protein ImpH